jgi:Ala-tRNA(Pro) deacylase
VGARVAVGGRRSHQLLSESSDDSDPGAAAVGEEAAQPDKEDDMITADLTREIRLEPGSYEMVPHRRTESARDEAIVLGIPPDEVAKTLILKTDDGFVRAVIPASRRLDLRKARHALGGGSHTRLATEVELAAAYPMFELGAVPPFGGPSGDRVLIDRWLATRERLVVEAGSHTTSIRMKTDDLLTIAGAEFRNLVTS